MSNQQQSKPLAPPPPTQEVDSAKASANTAPDAPPIGQGPNVAAAAGALEGILSMGTDCFSAGDYQGCINRMSEVLDAVPVHSMALHYLSQSEEKLRLGRLDPKRHREAVSKLSEMRRAHREGEPNRVIESANQVLAIDPESLEARWYRRNAETRLIPSRTRDGSAITSRKRPTTFQQPRELKPALVPANLSGSQRRSGGIWVLGGAGIFFLALIALIWGFHNKLNSPAETEATPSSVRTSPFDDTDGDVVMQVPPSRSPASPVQAPVASPRVQSGSAPIPSINSVVPNELTAGKETTVRLFGSNFSTDLILRIDGNARVVSAQALSTTLIEATLAVADGAAGGEILLTVVNADGIESLAVSVQVISPRSPEAQ